jgi:hypothetical protein
MAAGRPRVLMTAAGLAILAVVLRFRPTVTGVGLRNHVVFSGCTEDAEPPPRQAYLITCSGEAKYWLQALVAACSVRQFDRLRDIILLHPDQPWPMPAARVLEQCRVLDTSMDLVHTETFRRAFDHQCPPGSQYAGCWYKFFAFTLWQYSSVLTVDSDWYAHGQLDSIWQQFESQYYSPYDIGGVEDTVFSVNNPHSDVINGGMVMVRPSNLTYSSFMSFAQNTLEWAQGEMVTINAFGRIYGRVILFPWVFNVFPFHVHSGALIQDSSKPNIPLVHAMHLVWHSRISVDSLTGESSCAERRWECVRLVEAVSYVKHLNGTAIAR